MKIKIFILFLFVPFIVFAEGIVLPKAGLTPESPFYFFDKLGESFQRFFTFDQESRARLEITFAKERIAEMKLILEKEGDFDTRSISIIGEELSNNLSKANTFLDELKDKGKDTTKIAKEISDDFDPAQEEFENIFKSEADALDVKIGELKKKLKDAYLAGDNSQIEALSKGIVYFETQEDVLEEYEEINKNEIEKATDDFDEALGFAEEASEKIKDIIEEKIDLIKEAQDSSFDIPPVFLDEFNSFISQSEYAFGTGNYEEAKRLTKEAEEIFDEIENQLDDFIEIKEEMEDFDYEKEIQELEFKNKFNGLGKEEQEHEEGEEEEDMDKESMDEDMEINEGIELDFGDEEIEKMQMDFDDKQKYFEDQ
jgi:hypothetical protein